ncbi:hypothetical protein BB560_003728 [Smittium megazygosporum]|uniref:Mitochondrial import inner membrane translocase subunit TIM44 n=1 Tax=Smittium megazygosporum TaxID=133381 RepID=A0A2T9ZBA4_9FUNG|nr:hypothetical protein BB560_003728 [Smittium megazygosporum]
MLPRTVLLSRPFLRSKASFNTVAASFFHSGSFTRNSGHVSPIKAFTDSIKRQIEENKEFQQNAKLLGDKSNVVLDSEALKKAKEATSASAKVIKETASVVGEAIGEGFTKVADSSVVKATGKAVVGTAKVVGSAANVAMDPIKKTEAYKAVSSNVSSYVQEVGGRYGGYISKERRASRILSNTNRAGSFAEYQRSKAVRADPNAGSGIIMHKDSKWKSSWINFKDNNPLMQNIFKAQKDLEQSENPIVETVRTVKDKIRGVLGFFVDETESAQALRQIRDQIDYSFNINDFIRDCREYIIPEVMDAYLLQDIKTLKIWCSDAAFNVLNAIMTSQLSQGIMSDCKILDLRHVEFHSAKVLDNDVPVIIVTFQTQENNVFRNAVTNEIVSGSEDHIELCYYVSIFTKVPENVDDPITGGWKMIDLAKQSSRPTW